MQVKEYEAKLDAKNRVTLRGADSGRFRVVHRRDGSIVLKPVDGADRRPADTPATRKKRFDRVIAAAKAKGEKIPEGVKYISFRELTPAERARANAHAKGLAPLARKCLARNRDKAAA